ncbi:predicted protein [Methanosarcina acetivorans C2A]|uniref:Uncharacterized protein n=1 Tax=Methanosarcina acetivorans (strain ATCC 35395 / DSM 2834 / JCM 12185 / C2A) TaxID=188937 RepID=Q8TL53_METAC|nr:predicted protein [Methanosarcina acetivorans C2A]
MKIYSNIGNPYQTPLLRILVRETLSGSASGLLHSLPYQVFDLAAIFSRFCALLLSINTINLKKLIRRDE